MADIQKSVEIIFGGKDNVSPSAKAITGVLDELGATVDKTAGHIAGFAEGMLKIEAALAALAAGTLTLAVKEAGEFGNQISEISTLTNATADEIGGFRKEILEYARDSRKSIDDINQSIYQAVSLGIDYKDSLAMMKDAERLAVAGRAELVSTTELLGGTLNAYGESVDKAAKYSDVFFETVRLGKTTIPELAASLSRVTGLAANAGVPIETLASAIAALTATGAPTEQAITGIRQAIANIIDPAKKAREMAAALGIDFNAAALQSKGFEGVMRDIYQATGGNTEQIAALFESTKALNAVLTLASDKSGKFAESLKAMQAASGSTEAAYRKMADTFASANQQLANNVKATLIEVGEPLLKSYGDLAVGIVEIFKGLSVSFDSGAFEPIYTELNDFAGRVTEFLKGVSEALPEALTMVDFSPVINSLKTLGSSLGLFFEGLDFTKPQDLARALQAVIDTIGSMITVTSGMVDQFKPLWDAISGTIAAFNATDEASKKATGNIFALAIEIKEFGKTLTLMLEVMNWFGIKVEAVFGYFSNVAWRIGNIVDILKSAATFDWEGLKKSLYEFWSFDTRKQADDYEASLKGVAEAWWETGGAAKAASKDMADKTSGVISSGLDRASREIVLFGENFNNAAKSVATSANTDIVPALKKVSDEAKESKASLDKLPQKLQVAIELQKVDTAQFEAETRRMSSLLDFEVRIDTARIEAESKKVEAVFASIGTSVTSTGSQLSSIFQTLTSPEIRGAKFRLLEKQIEEENRRRDETLELQRDTIRAQVDLMQAKTRAIDRGEAIIKVSAAGLAPHLEAFMWEILEAIQVRASQEGLELLLGALA